MAVVPGLCWERAAGAAVLTCQLSIFLLAGPLLLAWVLVLASSWAPFLAYLAWWLWDLPTANSGGRSAGRLWNLMKIQSYDIWIMIVVCWWFVYLAGQAGALGGVVQGVEGVEVGGGLLPHHPGNPAPAPAAIQTRPR